MSQRGFVGCKVFNRDLKDRGLQRVGVPEFGIAGGGEMGLEARVDDEHFAGGGAFDHQETGAAEAVDIPDGAAGALSGDARREFFDLPAFLILT